MCSAAYVWGMLPHASPGKNLWCRMRGRIPQYRGRPPSELPGRRKALRCSTRHAAMPGAPAERRTQAFPTYNTIEVHNA